MDGGKKKYIFGIPVALDILNNCTIPGVDRNMVPKLILENTYALWEEYEKNDLDCMHNWIQLLSKPMKMQSNSKFTQLRNIKQNESNNQIFEILMTKFSNKNLYTS